MAQSPQQASRNRSISAGASELPQHEHKRPRLDTEVESTSSMGTPSEEVAFQELPPASSSTDLNPRPSTPSTAQNTTSAMVSPTSKVTINTRPLSAQSSSQISTELGTTAAPCDRKVDSEHNNPDQSSVTANASGAQDPLPTPGNVDDPISIESSPSLTASEVQEEKEQLFRYVDSLASSSGDDKIRPIVLWETFPYTDVRTQQEVLKTMSRVGDVFEKDQSEQFTSVFEKISTWIKGVLQNISRTNIESKIDSLEILKQIPIMVKALTQRKFAVPTSTSEMDIINFIRNFAGLTLQMICFDIQCLEVVQQSDAQTCFWSDEYLYMISQLIHPDQVCALYRVLRNTRQVQTHDFLTKVIIAIFRENPHQIFQSLALLFSRLVTIVPATSPSRLFIPKIVSCYRIFLTAVSTRKIPFNTQSRQILQETTSAFVVQAEEVLQQAISKQHQWLQIENSATCMEYFSRLHTAAVAIFPDMVEDIFISASLDPQQFRIDEMLELVSEAYRLSLLRKYIQQGRMELKVSGIETMATLLVELWTRITHSSGSRKSSLLNLVISFLRNSELVKYILSVDCHPQIIQRSINVIGFLCVSDRWTDEDSDMAWQAVLGSEDHRAVAAVVDNLRLNLQHLTLGALLYLYTKVKEVPFEKFDNGMFVFTNDLLNQTMTKSTQNSETRHQVNAKIVDLCFHILRESNTPEYCDSEISERIREHIFHYILMRERKPYGQNHIMDLDETERRNLISIIESEIKTHSRHATGSVLVMTALLASLDDSTAANMVVTTGFAGVILDDLIHLSKTHQTDSSRSQKLLGVEITARMNNLCYLVQHTPSAFDMEMCHSFWANILASDIPTIHSNAWASLASVYRKVDAPNQVLEFVAAQVMQNLSQSLFGRSVLDFCQASAEFEIRHSSMNLVESDDCLQIPSMERVWKIMLEAPEVEVQSEASQYIIRIYLGSKIIASRSLPCIQRTHSALIDRCIQTVIHSARSLSAAESSSDNQEMFSQHALCIQRTLDLLRKFLKELKSKNEFKPTLTEAFGPVLKTFQVRGQGIEQQLRINDPQNLRDGSLTWIVGEENTGHEIWQFLTDMLGWSQITIIRGGLRLQLEDNQTSVKDLNLGVGPFQVIKPMGASVVSPGKGVRPMSPVDTAMADHFRSLYELLDLPHAAAKPVYEFLTVFSSQDNVVMDIKSMSLAAASLLPVEKPFKLLYYANTLRSCIEEESFSQNPNEDFLQYTVRTIVTTLGHLQTVQKDQTMYLNILSGIIETLQLALRAKVPEATSTAYFEEPQAFTTNFLASWQVIHLMKQASATSHSVALMSRNFLDLLVEATLHEPTLWQFINEDDRMSRLFDYAMLYDPDSNSRISVLEIICKVAGVSPGKMTAKIDDLRSPKGRFSVERISSCLHHLWRYLKPLIAESCREPTTCEQTMEASVVIYDNISRTLNDQVLLDFFEEVKTLLFQQHDPTQHIYCANEKLPLGLARMLSRTISALTALSINISDAEGLARTICQQFLFPPLSDHNKACIKEQNVPLISMDARTALYDLLIMLCSDQNPTLVYALAGELSEGGIDKDAFSLTTSNERKALKLGQDYAGLRNLSNTCYLNSLFSQLFMNVKFRQLIIGASTSEGVKHKLVRELGNVFANMQCSYEKYVDPEEAVDSITQYTGEQIDVTVQMDVDEFFNLLFDRLEAQIDDPTVRDAFKSMYGGQLVQQIKSKECEHVSERLEPFSAVQIEIKGKLRLEEGLAAYVEGEVLQGENKYSCTGCGRHVDAVKRACLKEIPDNLIFNLKRFDYDIMTGMRCKVNDEFQFPDAIDMMPYTVDSLSNPEKQLPADMFELVGVIIHSGTAETGHYYSFIRKRPSVHDKKDSWVQFNDQDVTRFDLSQMQDQAFGGCDPSYNNFAKFYNGYMLFYQRSSSIRAYEQEFPRLEEKDSMQVKLPTILDNSIALDNEISLRRYVAQDASHAKFVRQIAERIRIPGQLCSDNHELETQTIAIILEYIQQVSSRWKEAPEFEDTIKVLCAHAKDCSGCALSIVEWFAAHKNLIDTIVRAWYPFARKNFAFLLQSCWKELSPLRHSDRQQDIYPTNRKHLTDALSGCLQKIKDDWKELQRYPRGWEPLFGMLRTIVALGKTEADAIIESDLLGNILEIVWVHFWSGHKGTPPGLRMEYNAFLANREKNKVYYFTSLLDLFADLLPFVCLDSSDRREAFELNDRERTLFALSNSDNIEWLRRMIAGGGGVTATNRVIKELGSYSSLADLTATTLVNGLMSSTSYETPIRFLRPCYWFVQSCKERKPVIRVIKGSLKAIPDADGNYGAEYLDYVKGLSNLNSPESLTSDAIQKILANYMTVWAPPLLLAADDIHSDVRADTVNLLHKIFFSSLENMSVSDARTDQEVTKILRSLAEGCCVYVSKNYTASSRSQDSVMTITSGQTRQISSVLEECYKYFEAAEDAEEETLCTEIQQTVQYLSELERNADLQDLEWEREPSSEPMSDSEILEQSP